MKKRAGIVIAKIILAVIGILGCVFVIYGLGFAPKAYAAEWRWQHFGADPFAKTRAEAMAKRTDVFRLMELPASVSEQCMLATQTPGEKIWIVNGFIFDKMLSKGSVVHKNVVVAFIKPNVKGNGIGYAASAEKWQITVEGKIYTIVLPEVCYNWSLALSPVASAPVGEKPFIQVQPSATPHQSPQSPANATPQFAQPTSKILACPDVYTLKVNVWEHKAIAFPGVKATHAKEELAKKELKERFVGVPHVSRKHGKQFRVAYANGELDRSAVARNFRVSLVMTPESTGGDSVITSEQVLGDITVTGLRELQFTRAQLEQWDVIRLVPIENAGILSPPRSNIMGLHELRFFNHLPNKKLGEWENSPVPDCIMNEHWIEE